MSTTTRTAGWLTRELVPSSSVRVFPIGERTAIFSERSQQLHEINEGAHEIWRLIEQGASLSDLGDGAAVALAREWLRLGYLAPRSAYEALERNEPTARLPVHAAGLDFELRFHGDADVAAADAVFGHLGAGGAGGAPSRVVSVVGLGGEDFVLVGDVPSGLTSRERTPPKLKTVLTEELLRFERPGFWTHGALLGRRGKRVAVVGSPGAGKSTLALALTFHGFAYGGDDIIYVDGNGLACGAPFAGAAKTGAWPLLARYDARIGALPIYTRPDDQRVRYIAPAELDGREARAIDVVILLSAEGKGRPRAEAATPLDALHALLASGWSHRRAADAAAVTGLARNLSHAACHRVSRGELPALVGLVESLVRD